MSLPPPKPIPKKFLACLQKHFAMPSFRTLQWEIIQTLIQENRDVCAVIATGYGKSLCYQFPAFYLNRVVLVISPLIALMEDQVQSMKGQACLLGSAQEEEDQTIKKRILALKYRVVYATPEYMTRGNGLKLLRDLGHNLALIAIDEAHCISVWGHEFRPAYRQLGQLRETVPHVQIMALTGTATQRVREDICMQMNLHNPRILASPLDRPNFYLSVRAKGTEIWSDLSSYLTQSRGSTIIYTNTIRVAEQVSQELTRNEVRNHLYHSKLPPESKKHNHAEFQRNIVPVMVATCAFGMGIDKSNVRLVMHYGAPSDLERYYQEIGRAGRDGQPAQCVLFQSEADAVTHKRLLCSQPLSSERSEELQQMARVMLQFIRTPNCRRRFLLQYFDDPAAQKLQPHRDCCDNCRKAPANINYHNLYQGLNERGQLDVSREASSMLNMLRSVEGHMGLGKLILGLRGSRDKKVPKICREHEEFGRGSHRPAGWHKLLAEELTEQGFIKNDHIKTGKSAFGFLLPQVTLKGCCWLDDSVAERSSILLEPSVRLLNFQKKKLGQVQQQEDNKDFEWGSDFESDELLELDKLVDHHQNPQLTEKSEEGKDFDWGPDFESDELLALDKLVDHQQNPQLTEKSLVVEVNPQLTELKSLVVDCQQLLNEQIDQDELTRKARKRVFDYINSSFEAATKRLVT